MITSFKELQGLISKEKKMKLVIVSAHDKEVLLAGAMAEKLGIIEIILIGNKDKIEEIAIENNVDLAQCVIIDEQSDDRGANIAVDLVLQNKADYILKGLLETSTLMRAVLRKENGLRAGSLLSHIMVYECDRYHKLLLVTDGGINIAPSLEEKVSIIKNSVNVSRALGNKEIKVACLAAKEKVDSKMKVTIDSFELQKKCEDGIFGKDVIVEGPLAFDIAISKEAANVKGVVSRVSGETDVLLVPTIEVGNGIGKALTYLANVKQGGVVIGAKVPIIMVSRSDSHESKLNSIMLGSIIANYYNEGESL